MPAAVYTIEEFAKAYKLGISHVYALARSGQLTVTKIGRRSVISVAEAERWFKGLPTGVDPGVLGRDRALRS
jgi:excisionase family DNA binding protein